MSDPTPIAARKNLVSIDIARAIAALGVFYYHLHLGYLFSHYTGLQFLAATDSFGATYAVPLFFLISGYCIHLANLKYLKKSEPLPLKVYYKRRLLRIYPAYIVALIVSIGINMLTHYNSPVSFNDFLIHLFMLQGFSVSHFNGINVVLWTVAVELAFYIIYPVFYYLRVRFSLRGAMLFALIVSVISITFFSVQDNITLVGRYFFLNLWFAWCCGAYLADKRAFDPTELKKPVYSIGYIVILVAFVAFMFIDNPHLIIIKYQISILVWTAPLLMLLGMEDWLSQRKGLFIKALAAIGLSSYSLYLFHEPLISLKNFLVHQYLPVSLQSACVIIGIAFIPVITWLTYVWFEKPFISKKRKLA